MKKTTIGLALAVTASLTLAGCSTASTPPAGDVSGDITYGIWDPNQQPAVDSMIEAFNKEYPDVTVTTTVTPFGQYWTTLQTQASSNTLPDVFWMNMPYFKLYASNGQLAPIDDQVSAGDIDISAYPEALTAFYNYDGTQYAVPKDVDTDAMWLNTAIFEQAGVDLPSTDWTYDDYREIAGEITTALSSQGVFGTAFYPFGQTTYYNSVFANGGSVISDDGTSSGWDSAGSREGLKIWADLIADGSAPTIPQLTDTSADAWFTSGKAAMFPSIAGASIGLLANDPNMSQYVAFPLPQGEGPATVGHSLSNVVSAKSANLPAAQAFQTFLASKDAQLIQSESGVALSAFAGTSDAFVASYPSLDLKVFVDAIDYSYPFPASINTDAWQAGEPLIVGQYFAGAITLDEAIDQLTTAMNEALAAE